MNRVIMFRFWLGHIKKMSYQHGLKEIFRLDWNLTDDIIPMQFTGLQDKNGKEAFESDITDGGVIIWHEEYLGFFVKDISGDVVPLYDIPSFEIVGNVFENPELLNQTKP